MGRGTSWLGLDKHDKQKNAAPAKVPPPDLLGDMFRHYKRARKLRDQEIAEELGTTPGYLQVKRHKGTDHWSVADVREMCRVLQITDARELGEAILGRK